MEKFILWVSSIGLTCSVLAMVGYSITGDIKGLLVAMMCFFVNSIPIIEKIIYGKKGGK